MSQQSMGCIAATSTTGGRRWWSIAFVSALVLFCVVGCGSTPSELAPGQYDINVTLTGGSGRASVESPTTLSVTENSMTATITWSSPNYTWMEVGGTRYTSISARGENSVFEIPVTLDVDIPVSAETTAMSQPHVIDYTLHFDSTTVKAVG